MPSSTTPPAILLEPLLMTTLLENSGEGIVFSDAKNKIIAVNRAFTEIMGFTPAEVVGQPGSFLRSGRHDDAFYGHIWQAITTEGHWQGEVWVRRKSGEVFPEWLVFIAVKNSKGEIINYIAIFSDITERKTSAERIYFLGHFDPLTSLPNRSRIRDHIELCLANAKIHPSKIAILSIDLDRFKNINTSLGLAVGDLLLQAVATRLQTLLQKNAMLARLGADNFMVVVPQTTTTDEASHIAQKILTAMQTPFIIDSNNLTTSATLGISIYPEDGADVDTLIKNANAARDRAKQNSRGNYQFFTEDMNTYAIERLKLENYLHQALEKNEFALYYQPLVSLATGKICGVEALIRWPNSPLGPISPTKFIPIAEESGMMIPLTQWVLKTACETNRQWLAAGLPSIPVAVNISSTHFRQADFKEQIARYLAESDLPPEQLKLELTEGVVMQDAETSIETLLALKAKGLRFSIDDFGTGYSSLSYLKRFPIDQLKIDQSFVHDLVNNADDRAIIRAIISLAKSLKLIIIAEGVETKEQLAFLRAEGCDVVQGYYFSKPVVSDDIMHMLKTDKQLE